MPDFESLRGIRVVADLTALDQASWPTEAIVMRVAPDEVIAVALAPSLIPEIDIADDYAIQVEELGYGGVCLPRPHFDEWFRSTADWDLPPGSPPFAQGAVAGLPVKLWVRDHEVLVVTKVSLRHELEARL